MRPPVAWLASPLGLTPKAACMMLILGAPLLMFPGSISQSMLSLFTSVSSGNHAQFAHEAQTNILNSEILVSDQGCIAATTLPKRPPRILRTHIVFGSQIEMRLKVGGMVLGPTRMWTCSTCSAASEHSVRHTVKPSVYYSEIEFRKLNNSPDILPTKTIIL